MSGGVLGPGEGLGEVEGEVETVIGSSVGSSGVVAHEQVSGGDAQALLGVRQVGELTLFARISRWLSEGVLDALFNGRVTDDLGGVSGVVGQTHVTGEDGSGLVLGDTSGDDASVVGQRVGELTSQTGESGGGEDGNVVFVTVSDWGEALESIVRKSVGGDTNGTQLEGRVVGSTEINVDFGVTDTFDSDGVGLEGQAVSAVVVGGATAGNVDALFGVFAVGLDVGAEASSSGAVVEDWAVGGDVVALISFGTPAGSGVEGHATTARVVGGATARNGDAGLLGLTPREAGLADALAGLTVMIGRDGAVNRESVTRAGQGAEAGANLEVDTGAAVVVGVATAWDVDAGLGVRAPGLAGGADAGAGLTVVVGRGGAIGGDVVTSVGQGAEAGVGNEGQTGAAVVVGGATRRDTNASSLGRTPGECGVANALKSLTVVVNGTDRGDVVASVGKSAEAGTGLEGQTGAAVVVGVATAGDVDASLGGRAPGLAGGADAGAGLTVVVGRGGAIGGDVVTSVGQGAEAGVGNEGQTGAAVVVGGATRRDTNASSLGRTPGESGVANTKAGLTVVVVRALGGDIVASVGKGAPVGTGVEGSATSAAVVGGATRGDGDARTGGSAPGLAGRADTGSGDAVVVRL